MAVNQNRNNRNSQSEEKKIPLLGANENPKQNTVSLWSKSTRFEFAEKRKKKDSLIRGPI